MKIYLHEITDQDTDLDFSQSEKWVADAVERVDERWDESGRPAPARAATKEPRTIRAQFNLRKVDEVVVVSGNIDTHIELICSRCANPFALKTQLSFSALFCKDPVMAGIAHLQQPGKPVGQNAGWARHAHEEDVGQHAGNLNQDLDITYLSQEFIDLSDVLTEQLQLQIPFQPLCREECKGMCTNCGADQNTGRCACSKLNKASPFAVLNNLKV
ncbi:MAG: YceD family protein [Bdellovibrionota bacterium]